MYDANRVLRRLRLYNVRYDYDISFTYVVKVHCNLWLLDKIEEIGRNDAIVKPMSILTVEDWHCQMCAKFGDSVLLR